MKKHVSQQLDSQQTSFQPTRSQPILYSFRRCPYAMRARLAIDASEVCVEIREILLRDKPKQMLQASAKGTVPVLVLPNSEVIDESLDIMFWALQQNDKWKLLKEDTLAEAKSLIERNDNEFKPRLDLYKYAARFPEKTEQEYHSDCEFFLKDLEERLTINKFLLSDNKTIADIAVFPFIRQFAFVDKNWFDDSSYKNLKAWLEMHFNDEAFKRVMVKREVWKAAPKSFV